jgi:hypothetical protein
MNKAVEIFSKEKIINVDELAAVSGKMAINCRSFQVAVVEKKGKMSRIALRNCSCPV